MTDIEWEHFHYFAIPIEYQVAVSPRPYVAYVVSGFSFSVFILPAPDKISKKTEIKNKISESRG